MQSLKYWVWLASVSGASAITANRLLSHFESPENVFSADEKQCRGVEELKLNKSFFLFKDRLSEADKILEDCAKSGISVITMHDGLYPERLRNIYDPPPVLYVKGRLPDIDESPVVAIVGTRNCTAYGIKAAESISSGLAESGLIVSTGLARGVDSAAVRGALRGGGSVIGVVGSGLFVVYPPENRDLFDEVVRSGAIISEYPPRARVSKAYFPARNRIISGVSVGVAVIEAPKGSGALITASRALEQGRDVFSLPGNVDARSCEGSNLLLREGAIAMLSAQDVISEYIDLFPDKITRAKPANQKLRRGKAAEKECAVPSVSKPQRPVPDKKEIDNITEVEYIDFDEIIGALEDDEKIVAEKIYADTVHIDTIILQSGLTPQRVLTAITMLEIKGYVVGSSGKFYSLANPS